MLADKTVKIEQHTDAVLAELKNVIIAFKSGKSPVDIALGELLKLQQTIQNASAVPGEFQENMPAAIRTCLLGAEDLAMVILGVAQPL